jgi:hypothetical protein
MPLLPFIDENLYIAENPKLRMVNLPQLIDADRIYVNDNPKLTSLKLHANLNSLYVDVQNNVLTQSNIDEILANFDLAGRSGGQMYIYGIDQASPSAAGLVSKANLLAKGWTFPINFRVVSSNKTSVTSNLSAVGDIYVYNNASLTTLNIGSVATVSASLSISENPLLQSVILNSGINSVDLNFTNNKLSQTSIDHILSTLDTAGNSNGALQIWGTSNTMTEPNAMPSASGQTSLNNLVAKGWMIQSTTYMYDSAIVNYVYPSYPANLTSNIYLYNNTNMVSADLQGLTIVNSVDIRDNIALATVDLSDLVTVTTNIELGSNAIPSAITSINLSSLISAGTINIRFNHLLTTLNLVSGINCNYLVLDGNNFTQATVDDILLKVDANGLLNGQLHLQGGTNAAPTGGAANAAVVSLISKGWAVNLNP